MTSREASETAMPARIAAIRDAVEAVRGVRRVALTGSRAADDPTPLSDWDFDVEISDEGVLDALEDALRPLPTLALFWDPLSGRANLIALLDGPIKVDVIVPDARNPNAIAGWTVTAQSLPRIDEHFWDWTLWLAAKRLRGNTQLVEAQLQRMWNVLLAPLGATEPPPTISDAIESYTAAGQRRAREHGVTVDPRLGRQVEAALVEHGVVARPPSAGRTDHTGANDGERGPR